jgi:hypothetical protein
MDVGRERDLTGNQAFAVEMLGTKNAVMVES